MKGANQPDHPDHATTWDLRGVWGGAKLPPQEATQHHGPYGGTPEPGLRPGEGLEANPKRGGAKLPPRRRHSTMPPDHGTSWGSAPARAWNQAS